MPSISKRISQSGEVEKTLSSEGWKIIFDALKKQIVEWSNILAIEDDIDLEKKKGGVELVLKWLNEVLNIKVDKEQLKGLPSEESDIIERLQGK